MESTHTPQQALIKLLAIIGFFAFVALVLWILVQGIRAFPSAFSSLASIAESINNYRPEEDLVVTTEKNIVNSGEVFTITWTEMGKGSYTFNFNCVEGIQFKVKTADGTLRDLSCTDDLNLPEEVHGLFAAVDSGEQRFSEVAYTITFIPKNGEPVSKENYVTVVNATVPNLTVVEEPVTAPEPVETPKPEPEPTPTPSPTPVKPAPVVIPSVPIASLPNGFIDLETTYLGVGTMVNGTFVPKTSFDEDDRAAFRFQVKNIGTKTSNTWSYVLSLPGAATYNGGTQAALRPTEYAIFTVGFDLTESKNRTVELGSKISTTEDANTKNNSFEWNVKVTD